MQTKKTMIPIFFSCDDHYLPFLSVAIASLAAHAVSDAEYRITVLHDGLQPDNMARISALANGNVTIRFVNVAERVRPLLDQLCLRDYYTVSIYFRLFIPAMFPQYDKAIYLDCDITVLQDIARLYETPLGDCLLGAVPDAIIAGDRAFMQYAEEAVGVRYREYFNSGVLLMNLERLRAFGLENRFAHLLRRYAFDTICPDQDYLNALCRGRVRYLDTGWNKMSVDRNYPTEPMLVHFNMYYKPWLYRGIPYEEYFWKYAEKSDFLPEILQVGHSFGLRAKLKNLIAHQKLIHNAYRITWEPLTFRSVLFGAEALDELRPADDLEESYFEEYDEDEAPAAIARQA